MVREGLNFRREAAGYLVPEISNNFEIEIQPVLSQIALRICMTLYNCRKGNCLKHLLKCFFDFRDQTVPNFMAANQSAEEPFLLVNINFLIPHFKNELLPVPGRDFSTNLRCNLQPSPYKEVKIHKLAVVLFLEI